jgi:Cdc6-like AAA superfamily ATPase
MAANILRPSSCMSMSPSKPMQEALVRLANYMSARTAWTRENPTSAARDMLMRVAPRIADGSAVRLEGEKPLDAGVRIAPLISAGVLPIQGPPGTGKTHTGGHMICELVRQGKKVGIVANGHEVIRNLLNKVIEVAEETNTPLVCIQKPKGGSKEDPNRPAAVREEEQCGGLRRAQRGLQRCRRHSMAVVDRGCL